MTAHNKLKKILTLGEEKQQENFISEPSVSVDMLSTMQQLFLVMEKSRQEIHT